MKVIFSFLFLAVLPSAFAQTHVGRIVKIENEATIYVPSNEQASKKDKLIKYLDKVYKIVPAEKGMKLENGFVVSTGPLAKLKIIFNNGDHIFVSPNTQYFIAWKREQLKENDPSTLTILRGAVRGLIEKDGPRSGMEVVTKNTTMGIRGTDFHVAHYNSGLTQISVLRGAIEMKNVGQKQEIVKIEAGQTFMKKEENTSLSPLTKGELKIIATDSKIKASEVKEAELLDLEAKATKATLADIKEYQPQLYDELKKSKTMNSDTLAVSTVMKLEEAAPEKKKKPDWAELLDDQDPYEKYKPKN
jgi:hypothetical protein